LNDPCFPIRNLWDSENPPSINSVFLLLSSSNLIYESQCKINHNQLRWVRSVWMNVWCERKRVCSLYSAWERTKKRNGDCWIVELKR
jgi:hypothetical protein